MTFCPKWRVICRDFSKAHAQDAGKICSSTCTKIRVLLTSQSSFQVVLRDCLLHPVAQRRGGMDGILVELDPKHRCKTT